MINFIPIFEKLSKKYSGKDNRYIVLLDKDYSQSHKISDSIKASFDEWYKGSDAKFSLVFPILFKKQDEEEHWTLGNLVFEKSESKLKVLVESYDSKASTSNLKDKLMKNVSDTLKRIADDLILDKSEYEFDQKTPISTNIQKATEKNTSGYYVIDFIQRLFEGKSFDDLKMDYLAKEEDREKLIKDIDSVEKLKPQEEVKSEENKFQTIDVNLLAKPKANEEPKKDALSERIAVVLKRAREMVLANYLTHKKSDNIDNISKKIKDISKLDKPCSEYLNTGKLTNNHDLKRDFVKYIPKDIIDPPTEPQEKKFMAKMWEDTDFVMIAGNKPLHNVKIKKNENETILDIIVLIQLGAIKPDRFEFNDLDCDTQKDKLERNRRVSDFYRIRENGASKNV